MNIKWIKERLDCDENQRKVIAYMTIAFSFIVFIPLFIIARYAVKSADDYGNFRDAEVVWTQTRSLWQLICYSVEKTQHIYKSWQGTYFNEFIQGILGGLCGDRFYCVGAYLTLVMFLGGQFYLFYIILVKMLNADKNSYITVTLSCIMMEALLMPSPVEAFYWFCGSLMYLLPWGISVVLIGVCVQVFLSPKNSKAKWIRTEILTLLLMIAAAGSNYISLISTLVILLLLSGRSWISKNNSKIFLTVNTILYILLSAANILAPGNQMRVLSAEAGGSVGYSAVESIIRSLYEAMNYIVSSFVLPYIIVGILLIPIFVKIAGNTNFKFQYPLLISILSFGVYAAQFTPNLYALGFIGEYRVLNIYRTTMTILVYWLELYWLGYLVRRGNIKQYAQIKSSIILPFWAIGICMFIYSLTLWGGSTVTTWSAVQSLRSGEAAQYKMEYDARLEILEDESIKEVYFEDYTYKPYLLYREDLSKNPENWVNKSVADIYDKEIVALK